jgi:hypothetical protein
MDGRSLLTPDPPRKRVFTEFFNDPHFPKIRTWASLRTHRYQYTEYYQGTQVVFREYYRLKTDPGELHNVLDDGDPKNNGHAARAEVLLHRARACSGAACP